jgi:hypothetical protein
VVLPHPRRQYAQLESNRRPIATGPGIVPEQLNGLFLRVPDSHPEKAEKDLSASTKKKKKTSVCP